MSDTRTTLGDGSTPRTDAFSKAMYDASCAAAYGERREILPEQAYVGALNLCRELEREVERLKASWNVAAKVADERTSMRTRSEPFNAAEEAEQTWITITGRGKSLWFEYDWQSVGYIAAALRAAAGLTENEERTR